MTPPIHLTLLALAELAPAARWWEEESYASSRVACTWGYRQDDEEVVTRPVKQLRPFLDESRTRVTCPACLVMLDWALENS